MTSSFLYTGSEDAYSRAIKLWGCRLRSSEHQTPAEFEYHKKFCAYLKVSLWTKPSSHVYCWPLTPQAYKHYSQYSLSIFVTLLSSSTSLFSIQFPLTCLCRIEQSPNMKNFKAKIPRPKAFQSGLYYPNAIEA